MNRNRNCATTAKEPREPGRSRSPAGVAIFPEADEGIKKFRGNFPDPPWQIAGPGPGRHHGGPMTVTTPPAGLLNARALRRADRLLVDAAALRVAVSDVPRGGRVIDCGCAAPGGLGAGMALAEIALADLGRVALAPPQQGPWPLVSVWTDQPVAACMAAQYAGWKLAGERFFAMGSGPMRAASGREPLFETIGCRERAEAVCGVLEARRLPPAEVFQEIAEACGIGPQQVTLAVAPTASQAGTLQVVARSVETALHKLHELGFDLASIESGFGTAPLPPAAADDLVAVGRTNDAVLYGAEVWLWLRGDDEPIAEVGRLLPSSTSPAYGEPFLQIFERAGRDFYAIDPRLFSPAVVTLVNLDTGRSWRFGQSAPEILDRSFRP